MSVIFRGKPACTCLAKWLPVYERELLRLGVIKRNIDIYQLIGKASASAGTHSQGGAYDIAQCSPTAIAIARQMGAAAWARTAAQGFDDEHQHGVLIGCPHNLPARYQVGAYLAGYNGLGSLGRGARDDGPRLDAWLGRDWQEGIKWAENRQRPKKSPRHVPSRWARFAHFKPYYVNDSIAGLDKAVRLGYNAIDLNFHVTKDGVIVCTHWAQPLKHGFVDPLGKINPNTHIQDLTWREVSRLRAPGDHRIRTMSRMLKEAKKRGLRVEFEAKNSRAFTDPKTWARVHKVATRHNLSLQVKVESWVKVPGGAPAVLAAAKEGGIAFRIVLPRGTRVLKKDRYWPVANYQRGKAVWV